MGPARCSMVGATTCKTTIRGTCVPSPISTLKVGGGQGAYGTLATRVGGKLVSRKAVEGVRGGKKVKTRRKSPRRRCPCAEERSGNLIKREMLLNEVQKPCRGGTGDQGGEESAFGSGESRQGSPCCECIRHFGQDVGMESKTEEKISMTEILNS